MTSREPDQKRLTKLTALQKDHFRSGATLSPEARESALKRLVGMIDDRGEELAEAVGRDLGRCWLESWSAEPGLARADAELAARELSGWHRTRYHRASPAMLPGSVRARRRPFGTAVIVGPWNYPAGLVLCPMVSALAAGNTVILKPSERAPATSAALASCLPRFFDPSEVAVVEGGGDTASWLTRNAADVVCFTGSTATGRKVMADAASRPIPAVLELGGANPCFVAEDAPLRQTARRIAWGRFFGAGQTCLAPNHVFAAASIEGELLDELAAAVEDFYGADPSQSPDYGRIIDAVAWNRLSGLLTEGTPVVGGKASADDLYVAPTVMTDVGRDSRLVLEETFGPVLPVIPTDSLEEEMERVGRGDSSPLAAYGFSARPRRMERMLASRVRAGSLTVNGTLHRIVSSSVGFGGVGGSGFGRYRGEEGYRSFSWEQVVLRKSPRLEMPMLYPPYRVGRKLIRMLARFF